MVELLSYLIEYCGFIFVSGRFRFVDSMASSAHGNAMIVLESPTLRLRFTRDRGKLFLDVQPVYGPRSPWFPLGLLRRALTGESGGAEVLNPEWAAFLQRSLDELERQFGDTELSARLIMQLKHEQHVRASEL